MITGAIRHAKLQLNCHHQQTNTQLFTNRVSACHPTNSVKALKGNKYHNPRTCSPQAHLESSNLVFDH